MFSSLSLPRCPVLRSGMVQRHRPVRFVATGRKARFLRSRIHDCPGGGPVMEGNRPSFKRGGNPSCVLDQQQSSKNAAAPSAMPHAGRTTRYAHRVAPSCRGWTVPISFPARVRPEHRVLPVLPKRPALLGHLRLLGHPSLRELPRRLVAQERPSYRVSKSPWHFALQ